MVRWFTQSILWPQAIQRDERNTARLEQQEPNICRVIIGRRQRPKKSNTERTSAQERARKFQGWGLMKDQIEQCWESSIPAEKLPKKLPHRLPVVLLREFVDERQESKCLRQRKGRDRNMTEQQRRFSGLQPPRVQRNSVSCRVEYKDSVTSIFISVRLRLKWEIAKPGLWWMSLSRVLHGWRQFSRSWHV